MNPIIHLRLSSLNLLEMRRISTFLQPNKYSTIIKALIVSNGVGIILPKLKSYSLRKSVDQLRKFSVATLVKIAPQQSTHLEKITVLELKSAKSSDAHEFCFIPKTPNISWYLIAIA